MNHAQTFLKNGWFILDLPNPKPVFQARSILQKKIQELTSTALPLEQYHEIATDDHKHTQLQVAMTQFYRESQLGPRIIEAQLAFFQDLLGPDLSVQANPYLRITRPQKPQDNIGYHRDTFYGGSPYELSVFIPFVNLPPASSLGVISASHVLPDHLFPVQQTVSEEVVKGSDKHQLGFLYAPKVMEPSIEKKIEPIALQCGQALIFGLSTVHGTSNNRGLLTRWSSDIRVMNALAPVDLKNRPDYYRPLSASAITTSAKQYFVANKEVLV